jgi:AraC-like DNA-binding protein
MIETPNVLSETPETTSATGGDLLSLLLDGMRLSGMVLFRAEFSEPWAVMTPDSDVMAQMLPFHTEHVIPFHLIAEGSSWLELDGHGPRQLADGDAMLLPYGDGHGLRGHERADYVPLGTLLSPPPWNDIPVVRHGGGGTTTHIVCGFLQCDELFCAPVLRHLPKLIHVNPSAAGDNRWLADTIRHTAEEVLNSRPGSHSMLSRLTELMFVEILREHMRTLSLDDVGWFAAVNDPVVGTALKYLHTAPLEDWSVQRLAENVGVSRSVLADRFKLLLQQPPMQYLTHWRLQLAAYQLKTTNTPLKTVAGRIGYDSEAAFSRAFKRRFGSPPADWRKHQRATW